MPRIMTLSLAGAALAATIGGAAHAQATSKPAPTRAAVEQRASEVFARLDANGDGRLDRADRDARRQERLARRDANSDGQLTQADRAARRQALFARIDADGNGAISVAEFSAQRDQRGELRAERRGRTGLRAARRGAGIGRAADTNRDGTVTQAEFASAALARFDRVDVDKDGTISDNERPKRRAFQRGNRRGPNSG